MSSAAIQKRIHERRAVLEAQPETKWIQVIEPNGTSIPVVKRHLVRQHAAKDMDFLKTELTSKLNPQWGAIRNIYTPAGMEEIIRSILFG